MTEIQVPKLLLPSPIAPVNKLQGATWSQPSRHRGRDDMRMLIGMLALLIFVTLYVGLVLFLADQLPAATPALVLLVFYIVSGLVWTWPAKWILLWIIRPA